MCRFNAKYNLDFEKIRQLLVTKNKTKIVSEKRFHKTNWSLTPTTCYDSVTLSNCLTVQSK